MRDGWPLTAHTFLPTRRACTENFSGAHFSPSAPLCFDKTRIHHFAGTAHTLFHSCLTRILRSPSCICFCAFCLQARIAEAHSTFSSECHDSLLQQSGFLTRKGFGNSEPLDAFSAHNLNPSWSSSQWHQPQNVNAIQWDGSRCTQGVQGVQNSRAFQPLEVVL